MVLLAGAELNAAPPTILICALDPLNEALHDTLIWRDGLERHVATTYRDAMALADSASPDLIVVDRDMPQAERLVEDLRLSKATKEASIVVIASGPMNDAELGLLTAGANAVLRLPAGTAWEQKLGRLIEVPSRHPRRDTRTHRAKECGPGWRLGGHHPQPQ